MGTRVSTEGRSFGVVPSPDEFEGVASGDMYVWARVSLLDCGDASIKEGYGRGHPYGCETLWGYYLAPRWG